MHRSKASCMSRGIKLCELFFFTVTGAAGVKENWERPFYRIKIM